MKTKRLKLDPAIAKTLPGTKEHQRKVQWYLDHREELSTFMDMRVDFAFKFILGHKDILLKFLNRIAFSMIFFPLRSKISSTRPMNCR